MIRGTTPTYTFKLPIDVSVIKTLRITFEQCCKELNKNTEDCSLSGTSVSVRLKQEDTLMFSADLPVSIQIKVLTTTDDALVSRVMQDRVLPALNDEVLT